MTPHPTAAVLLDLALGTLDGPPSAEARRHVARCAECARSLALHEDEQEVVRTALRDDAWARDPLPWAASPEAATAAASGWGGDGALVPAAAPDPGPLEERILAAARGLPGASQRGGPAGARRRGRLRIAVLAAAAAALAGAGIAIHRADQTPPRVELITKVRSSERIALGLEERSWR